MLPFLTPAQMSDRRSKGLCYYCPEKYSPEHVCIHKKPQLYWIQDQEEEVFEDSNEELEDEIEDEGVLPKISVSAVSGIAGYKTMRVRGLHEKKVLFILIDSGSTHNFMDLKMANKLGCRMKISELGNAEVADGGQIPIRGKLENFKWSFHDTDFHDDFMIIPLGGCDMVFGIQWLETLGPITWDFKKLEMKFILGNKKIQLLGIQKGSVREVKATRVHKWNEEKFSWQ